MKLAIAIAVTIIGTIIMRDKGPSAQEEAEDFAYDPVAIPASYETVKATADAASSVLADRIARAYAQGRADAERDGCKRKYISRPLGASHAQVSQ